MTRRYLIGGWLLLSVWLTTGCVSWEAYQAWMHCDTNDTSAEWRAAICPKYYRSYYGADPYQGWVPYAAPQRGSAPTFGGPMMNLAPVSPHGSASQMVPFATPGGAVVCSTYAQGGMVCY